MSDAQERAREVMSRKREDSASMLRSRRAETLLTDLAAAGLSIVETAELERLRRTEDEFLTLTDRESYGAALIQCQDERRRLLAFRDAEAEILPYKGPMLGVPQELAKRMTAARAAVADIEAEGRET